MSFRQHPFQRGMYMIISSTVTSQSSIQDSRFKTAGWLSILGLILLLPEIVIMALYSSNLIFKPLFLLYFPLVAIATGFTVFVLIQFKRLLKERYDMHKADGIITFLIVINIVIAAKDIILKTLMGLPHIEAFMGILDLVVGVLSLLLIGIIQIILGVYLLSVRDDPSGLFRIYAILYIVASACLLTIILIPIALLLHLVDSVILAILFFRAAETETMVEFV
jgi:hypothetical protein